MTPETRAVARRYARALDAVVAEQGADGASVKRELDAWAKVIQDHPEAREALTSPAVPAELRVKAARGVAERVKVSPLVARLVEMLAARRRLDALPDLARVFGQLWNARRGVTEAEVVTAAPLDRAEREALARALAARTGGEVELTTAVEPDILGGVVVRMAGRTYDGSVRTRLARLRARLAGGV